MQYFPSLRVYDFTVLKKCLDTRGRSTQWLAGSCIEYFIPIESVLKVGENFLHFIFFVFVMEQAVSKTKWFQESVLIKSVSWTYLLLPKTVAMLLHTSWFCSQCLTHKATVPNPLPRHRISLHPSYHIYNLWVTGVVCALLVLYHLLFHFKVFLNVDIHYLPISTVYLSIEI